MDIVSHAEDGTHIVTNPYIDGRYIGVVCAEAVLEHLFCTVDVPPVGQRIYVGLPEGVRLVGVLDRQASRFLHETRCLVFVFSHDEFPRVRHGEPIPAVSPVFTAHRE
jgi:hypothetical protein